MRFDHDQLDVYNRSIEFVAWVGVLLEGPLSACHISAVKQLDRASTSIPLNIAEGNGKRSLHDRYRFFDIARGSTFESAACLDVLVARNCLAAERVGDGRVILVRIASMLSRMVGASST